jgi:hypothetical protein
MADAAAHQGAALMAYRLKFVLAVASFFLFLGGGNAKAKISPADYLSFQHVGPQDAALRPFAMRLAKRPGYAAQEFRLSEDAYRDVVMLVDKGAKTLDGAAPFGTFEVSTRRKNAIVSSVFIDQRTMTEVIDRLIRMYQTQSTPAPELLTMLRTMYAMKK